MSLSSLRGRDWIERHSRLNTSLARHSVSSESTTSTHALTSSPHKAFSRYRSEGLPHYVRNKRYFEASGTILRGRYSFTIRDGPSPISGNGTVPTRLIQCDLRDELICNVGQASKPAIHFS